MVRCTITYIPHEPTVLAQHIDMPDSEADRYLMSMDKDDPSQEMVETVAYPVNELERDSYLKDADPTKPQTSYRVW